jgi:hypothetical protein
MLKVSKGLMRFQLSKIDCCFDFRPELDEVRVKAVFAKADGENKLSGVNF